jgi:hypothetical protein
VFDFDFTGKSGGVEPAAELREAAATTYQIFVAFEQSGFTETQAFQLTRDMLTASIAGGNKPEK